MFFGRSKIKIKPKEGKKILRKFKQNFRFPNKERQEEIHNEMK